MKILVTGGAGFIGSNTVDYLIKKNFDVTVVDNLSTGFKELLNPEAEFFEGSFGDKKLLEKALKGVEAVIHLGAFSSVEESVKNPLKYYKNNLADSVVLLEEMRKKNIEKLIFSSSASVYGEPKKIPVTEASELNPISPYGETKLGLEKILELYFHSFGLKSISLRYFNAFGPKELHEPETHAIPNFIKAVLEGKKINVFGSGKQQRDFVFVKDLVKAHVLALEELDEIGFEVFNVGSGESCSVKEVIDLVFDLTGKKTAVNFLPPRKGDPRKLTADISKIKKKLHWKPETDFKASISKTIEFFKENY